MEVALAMYNHGNDKYGKGMRSYEWLLAQIDRHVKKDRGAANRKTPQADINKRGLANGVRCNWLRRQGRLQVVH